MAKLRNYCGRVPTNRIKSNALPSHGVHSTDIFDHRLSSSRSRLSDCQSHCDVRSLGDHNMASSIYLPVPPRGNGHKGRLPNVLPSYSTAVQEKLGHRHSHSLPWIIPIILPIPGVKTRRLRILIPNFARFHQFSVTRFGRKKGPALLCMTVFAIIFTFFALAKRFAMQDKKWPTTPFGTPPTLVFGREDLQRIWQWEIQSGHYPSAQKSMLLMDIFPCKSRLT